MADITGFGLSGHALEMAEASDVTLRIEVEAVPVMAEALEMYRRGVSTGASDVNRELVESAVRFEREADDAQREILVDPQTSGPLLAAVAGEGADRLPRGTGRRRSLGPADRRRGGVRRSLSRGLLLKSRCSPCAVPYSADRPR